MVRIAITQAAYDAIARTMPLGSFGFERDPTSGASAPSGWRTQWWIAMLLVGFGLLGLLGYRKTRSDNALA
jgi:hypothetical protein